MKPRTGRILAWSDSTQPRGAGLQNMSDRLEVLGGGVEVTSEPGRGTTVSGRVPVGPVEDPR